MKIRNIITVLFIYAGMSGSLKAQQARRPNVIFILADDMGYADVGSYGQKQIKTPRIDQLVDEGLQFTNFYAGAPVCSPSRGSLITGLNTGHATIRGNNTLKGGLPGAKGKHVVYRTNIAKSDYTLGNLMQDAGYETYLVGKWHIGGYDSTATPLQHGFKHFSGWLINKPETYSSTYWPDHRYREGRLIKINENSENKKGYYETNLCTDEALAYLNDGLKQEKPFFLMLNYNNPHSPLDAPTDPQYNNTDWPEEMKTYASMVSNLDRSIGRIIDFLKQTGLDKKTLVFVSSDNGPRSEPTPQLTRVAEFFDSNGKLRGYKRDLYEGGIRIPTIAWAPSIIKEHRQSTTVAYFPDIMPTLAQLAEYKGKFKTDGISLYDEITNQKRLSGDRFLYWEFFENGFEQAVRFGKWKAVKHSGKMELYDLAKDPSEQFNIAQNHPDIISKIEDYLKHCRSDSPYWPIEEANKLKQLRDLKNAKKDDQ